MPVPGHDNQEQSTRGFDVIVRPRARFAGGALTALVGVVAVLGLVSVPAGISRFDPGPVVVPMGLAGALILLGLFELFKQAHLSPVPRPSGDRPVLEMAAIMAAFLVALRFVGLLFGLGLIAALTCRLLGGSVVRSVLAGILIPLSEFVLFQLILNVPLTGS